MQANYIYVKLPFGVNIIRATFIHSFIQSQHTFKCVSHRKERQIYLFICCIGKKCGDNDAFVPVHYT